MFPLEREDDFILPEGQIISDEDKESLYRQRRSAKAMIRLIDDQIGENAGCAARARHAGRYADRIYLGSW